MGKTLKEIKTALPELKSEKVDVLSDELDKILAIKKLFQSEGGKILIDSLRSNCAITLRKLMVAGKATPDLQILLALIADYSANMSLLASVQDISLEAEIRNQLDEAVREAYNA